MTMTKQPEQLPRPAAELERLAETRARQLF
jgi:hypothetical protein